MLNFAIKEERLLDFLREDVKSVIAYDNDKKVSQSFYNENGNRILRYFFDDNISIRLKQKTTFEYEVITGYINYDIHDNQIGLGEYVSDYLDRIVAKYHDCELEEENEYNILNQIVKLIYSKTGAKEIYEYDKKGFVIRQLSIQGENSIFGSLFGGPKEKLTTFENDDKGNVLNMKVFNFENNHIVFSQINSINIYGDEIKSLNLNGDGSVYSEINYEYNYDQKGNWISKKTLDSHHKIKRIEKRNILYFSEQNFNIEKDQIITNWKFKSKRLNGKRLALLFMALSKNLFERPSRGEVYYEVNDDRSCTLFFAKDYFNNLKESINAAFQNGKFSRSNSEKDWNDLKYAIDSAEISEKDDIEQLKIYEIYKE